MYNLEKIQLNQYIIGVINMLNLISIIFLIGYVISYYQLIDRKLDIIIEQNNKQEKELTNVVHQELKTIIFKNK